jgi:hypothetical protein
MSSGIESSPPFQGSCNRCQSVHGLGEGDALPHARKVMEGFRKSGRLDYLTPLGDADPRLRGSRLWEMEGRMFGVLEGRTPAGETVFLRAFSSLAGGLRWVPGWVPPLVERSVRASVLLPGERRIKSITRSLDRLGPGHPDRDPLLLRRKQQSRDLMAIIQEEYRLRNFRGEERSIRDAFLGEGGLPGGVGECCAPKLLTEAARLGLRPRGMVEFFWGASPPSGNRVQGNTYPACTSRCEPILGFLLCGLNS